MCAFERFRKAFVKSCVYCKGQIYQQVENMLLVWRLPMERALDINTHRLIFIHTLWGCVPEHPPIVFLTPDSGNLSWSFYLQIWSRSLWVMQLPVIQNTCYRGLVRYARMSAVLPISGVLDVSDSAKTEFRRLSGLSSYREVQSRLDESQNFLPMTWFAASRRLPG